MASKNYYNKNNEHKVSIDSTAAVACRRHHLTSQCCCGDRWREQSWQTLRNASTVRDLPTVSISSLEWMCSNACWAMFSALQHTYMHYTHIISTLDVTLPPSQQVRTLFILRCSSDGLQLVSGLSSGPNTKHWQLQTGIKDSPVCGATGHVEH